MTKVVHITSVDQWNEIVLAHEKNKNILVCKYSAEWCGPCRALAPKVDALSLQYDENEVVFLSIDIDECQEIADKFNVSSLPTTLVIKNCKPFKQVVGADIVSIKAGIDNALVPDLYQ